MENKNVIKAVDVTDFEINLTHCDNIKDNATELKALLSYKSPKMIKANKTRALACIDSVMCSLNELKAFIESEGQ